MVSFIQAAHSGNLQRSVSPTTPAMASRYGDGQQMTQIISLYNAADFRNVVDIGPIQNHLRTEDLKAGFEPKCGDV